MSVKILGGVARGFPLATPRTDTRPTSVMIKRKLFDWRQNLEGFTFADVCGGSGAMAYEALSRGADRIAINELNRGAFLTVQKNRTDLMKSFNFTPEQIHVTALDARRWVERELSFFGMHEDQILFFDPPYGDHALYREILALLKAKEFPGEVWVESDHKVGISLEELTGVFHSIIKTVEHGDHFVVVGKLI